MFRNFRSGSIKSLGLVVGRGLAHELFEGIGEVKKQQLLKKFGSIEKIKKAEISEISSIKGINEKLAKKLKEEL